MSSASVMSAVTAPATAPATAPVEAPVADGTASSGFSRMVPPGRNATGSTPQARANAPYSPLGSTTQARRPNTASRHR